MGPQIQDIYDDVIYYQSQNKYLFPENTVLLSGIINYMKSIGINEFIIMDYSCSAVEGISLSDPNSTRNLRAVNRSSPTPFTPLVSKYPRDSYHKGGKQTKKYRSKKTTHRRKLGRKTRKRFKNKKRF